MAMAGASIAQTDGRTGNAGEGATKHTDPCNPKSKRASARQSSWLLDSDETANLERGMMMTMITKKGRELADLLRPSYLGCDVKTFRSDMSIFEICSLICRHATTHHRLMEQACNGYPDDKAEQRIERLITGLSSELPLVKDKAIKVKFGGEPRGYTVKLIMPDGRYNTWGGSEDGIGVPT